MDVPKVIFQDQDILVLDKPSGLVTTTTYTNKEETLEDFLKQYYDKLEYHNKNILDRMGIVHRLDKDTSGCLVVAKNLSSFTNLQNQFKERKVKKEYLALVHGLVEKRGKVEGSIARNPIKHDKFSIMEDGREAETEYEPLERLQFTGDRLQEIFSDFSKPQLRRLFTIHYSLFTLVACRPLTGRTHQIRVHLKYINHPIVSDEKYGGRKFYKLDIKWCPRLFLHAKKIGFYHPGSGKWMEFECELPEDLENSLSQLTELRS